MLRTLISIAATAAVLGIVTPANAVVEFDEDVTNNVIMGSGIGNGGFTTDRQNGIELGMRGKLRFDAGNQPQNIFNSNNDGTYSFAAGLPPTGFSFDPNSPTTPIWNFEWSINSSFDGTGANLDQFDYRIGMDFDPGVGTNFQEFDPINIPVADHSIGTNATAESAGAEADGVDAVAEAADYVLLIANNNLAQNSWSMEFFNNGAFDIFDPEVDGTYDFFLEAFERSAAGGPGQSLARVDIQIIVGAGAQVPEPAALSLFAVGLLGLGFAGYRRRRQTS